MDIASLFHILPVLYRLRPPAAIPFRQMTEISRRFFSRRFFLLRPGDFVV